LTTAIDFNGEIQKTKYICSYFLKMKFHGKTAKKNNKKKGHSIIIASDILFSFIPAPKFNTTLKNQITISKKQTIPSDPVSNITK